MALVPHKITALEQSNDPNVNTLNTVTGAVVSLFDSQGQAVLLYDDELGANPSTTKTTDSSGQVVVWVTAGEYDEAVNGSTLRRVSIGGVSVSSYAATSSMQSSRPTETGLRSENRERGFAQYELAASGYVAQAGDVTAANGRVWILDLSKGVQLGYFDSIDDAVTRCVAEDLAEISINDDSFNPPSETDMQGVGITGNGKTEIINARRLLNCGMLKGCIVAGFSTDVDYIVPVEVNSGKTPKALYRLDDGSREQLHVITKSASRGYTIFTHNYDLYGTGSTDAAGQCENWRSTYIKQLANCYVMKRNPSEELNGWDDFADILWSRAFGSGASGGVRLQYKAAQSQSSEISYTVNSNKIGKKGNIAFYCSDNSTQQADVYVNGVLQRSVNTELVGDNYIITVEYELTAIGENIIRVDKPASGPLYVIGVEFSDLEHSDPNGEYDYLCYGYYPLAYVDSTGAQDYAIFCKDDQKWIGSYHGGETERSAAVFNVDGVNYSAPTTDGDFILGRSIRIEQSTTLAVGSNSLDCDSTWSYINDSVQGFDCVMSGSAKAEFFYTTMTTTNDDFDDTRFPYKKDVLSGSERFGRYNKIVQANESDSYPLKLTTYLTLFPMGGDLGINADHNGVRIFGNEGSYNKVYYGPLTNSEATINEIGFSNVKVFE